MNMLLSPSLLSSQLAHMADEAELLAKAGITWLHIDIMDGSFVPNITFGPPVVKSLRSCTNLFFDVHLMINSPERYVEAFAKAGADLLAPHLEAMQHAERTLAYIRQCGMKAGVALNPDTDPSRLRWLLPDLDMIIIMGVNPGFSGQKFIPQTIDKIRECREFLSRHGYGHMPIQVDGGACPELTAKLVNAGANVLVSGSAFFRYKDYGVAVEEFEKACGNLQEDENRAEIMKNLNSWKHDSR